MILTPEPYQQIGRRFFADHDAAYGCIGLGLGKTATSLMAIRDLLADGACKAALIVAPVRVATLTWPNEIAKWDQFHSLPVESIRGREPSGKSTIYLTNYERLQELDDLSFCDTVVFDEITKLKNPQSKRARHLRKLFKGHRRWGLTGTPRPNSLLDLYGQIRVLDDGKRLFPTFTQFQRGYFQPTDYMEYNWEPKKGAEDAIYKRISDITLTQRTSDFLDLPDTIQEDVEVALPYEAKAIYKELAKELLVLIERQGMVVANNAASLVNKLLQVAGGAVYNETRGVLTVHDRKIQSLKDTLKEIGNENTLIFTNYIHERERVVAALGDGAVDASKFKGNIEDAWNSGQIRYLVADPRSMGHGLNLQAGGRTIIWFSPTWSREAYDQANARLARKGQTQQPRIYRLLCRGTMDDAVVESLHEKGAGQSAMLAVLSNFQRLSDSSR